MMGDLSLGILECLVLRFGCVNFLLDKIKVENFGEIFSSFFFPCKFDWIMFFLMITCVLRSCIDGILDFSLKLHELKIDVFDWLLEV